MNSISRLHKLFKDRQEPLILNDITTALNLKPADVSMTLCYFLKQNYCTRKQVRNLGKFGKKFIWQYTYTKH